MNTPTPLACYPQGCFLDKRGVVRDVANPGLGLSCVVMDGVVMVCNHMDEGYGAEIVGEFTHYPTLDALRAAGYDQGVDGKSVPTTSV